MKTNSVWLNEKYKCDNKKHCGDGSDELGCVKNLPN